jgi:hypothetical protein
MEIHQLSTFEETSLQYSHYQTVTLALAIRAELFLPGAQLLANGTDFARIFTVHGTNMLLLWVIPFAAGVGNYLIPIMVRYKDGLAETECSSILDDPSCCSNDMDWIL